MERKTQTGYLVLADISGYTSFVAQTEIEHAGMALSYLLETIVEKMDDLLTIAKLEGDAVFAYVEDEKLEDCQLLMGLIDRTYLAFRDKALALHSQATCPCRACRALPTLDLKFILHLRLLKNGVSESTGWKGYALFTDQTLEHMQCSKDNFFKRCETYEHLGDVDIYCMDMHIRYNEMKAL